MDYDTSFGIGVGAVISYIIIFTIFGNLIAGDRRNKESNKRYSVEEKRESRKWWSKVRLPMDLLRWISIATFLSCLYTKSFTFSIAIIPFIIYDTYVLLLLLIVFWKGGILKENQVYLLLGYSLIGGFPIGTYSKLALSLYADDILPSFAVTLMPFVAFIGPVCGSLLTAYIWLKYFCRCCGFTKHNDSRSFGCIISFVLLVIGLIISVIGFMFFSAGSITKGLEVILFPTNENNTFASLKEYNGFGNSTPNPPIDWNEIDEKCYFNLFLPIKNGIPIMEMYVDSMETWAHMFVPVWCLLTFMLLLASVFITYFINVGPRYHVTIVIPEYVTLWGYTITLLLVAYSLDNPEQNTSFSTVATYGIPFYPIIIVEIICFIYNFIWFMKLTNCSDVECEKCPGLITKIRIGCSCCYAFQVAKHKERGCLWNCCMCLNCVSCCRCMCKPCFGTCMYCLEDSANAINPSSNTLIEEILMDDFGPEPTQKPPEKDIQTWDKSDVCLFLSSLGLKFETFMPSVLTNDIDGQQLMGFTSTDYEDAFNLHSSNDIVYLLKLQVECLNQTLRYHPRQKFGAFESVWCQSWYGLDDTERDNLRSMDYKSVAVWLYHCDCSDIRTLLCNQRVDGMLLHAYYSVIQHSHCTNDSLKLNNEQLVLVGAMNVLSLINYNFNLHFYLWDLVHKDIEYISILFPFWNHQKLLSYIETDCNLSKNTLRRHNISRKCNGSTFFLTQNDMDGFFIIALKALFAEEAVDFEDCENCFYKLIEMARHDALQLIESQTNDEITDNENLLQKLKLDFSSIDKYLRGVVMQIDTIKPVLMTRSTLL